MFVELMENLGLFFNVPVCRVIAALLFPSNEGLSDMCNFRNE